MSKDTYIGIIQDQRRSLYELMEEAVVPRRPMERIELLHPCAQVVVGMRRCGKSVLCRMALKAHPEIKFGYIDFDDEKLRDVQPDDLNDMTVRIVDVVTWLLEAPKEEPPKWGEPPA